MITPHWCHTCRSNKVTGTFPKGFYSISYVICIYMVISRGLISGHYIIHIQDHIEYYFIHLQGLSVSTAKMATGALRPTGEIAQVSL